MAQKKTRSKYDKTEIQILYKEGMTTRKIAQKTGVPQSTVARWCKGIIRDSDLKEEKGLENEAPKPKLPDHLRAPNPALVSSLEGYIKRYKKGTRFLPNIKDRKRKLDLLSLISLEDLQELCDIPTDYHSDLSLADWAVHYAGGKEGRFLVHAPHKWCKIQFEIFKLWEKHQMLMVETFRGIGKTMVADLVLTREICENPDNNYFIMSETKEKAGARVKHIGDTLLTNKLMICDYGFLPATKKYGGTRQSWRGNKITVKRHFFQTDPTLAAFSTETKIATGAHYAGGVFDDVWSFGLEQNSEKNKAKWLGWRDGELEGCMEHAWEMYLLTRKGPNDLYQEIEDRQIHVIYKRPAVIKFPTDYKIFYKGDGERKVFDHVEVYSKDWEISDDGNGRFSIEYFIEKMTKMDQVHWESEYQLNPMASTGKFWDTKDLRYIRGYQGFFNDANKYGKAKQYKVIGFIDLGFGKTARADYTALAIVARWENRFYVLESYLKRGATEKDLIGMCRKACDTFPDLRIIFIEDDLQQTNKVERLKLQIPFVIIKGFSSRQESNRLKKEDSAKHANLEGKPLRIWCQIEPIMTANNLYVNQLMHHYKEFKDEMTAFPSCKYFDLIDAIGNATGILSKKGGGWWILRG